MKHTWKITAILLLMFFITQLIGLAVVYSYTPVVEEVVVNGSIQNVTTNPLPYGMEPPVETEPETMIWSIFIAFIIAIAFVMLLTKLKAAFFIRAWFFIVIILVLGITLNAGLRFFISQYTHWIALAIALPLAIYKIYKRNILVHNFTELLIYPGIAAVFVPLLSVLTIIILLIAISIYDMWAVWHTGFMQKMAKYQINELKLFGGFFVPYLSKRQKMMLKKAQAQAKKTKRKKEKKLNINVAILGGGDVVFPIITAGVILRVLGIFPALAVSICATAALGLLFYYSKKAKFYPAMPFISGGLFVGIGLAYLIASII